MPLLRKEVAAFFLCAAAVFDGAHGAAADAGHAVRTLPLPDGPPVFDDDVVHGADGGAFSAGDAAVRGAEGAVLDDVAVKDAVYCPALQPVERAGAVGGEGLPAADAVCAALEHGLGPGDDTGALLLAGGGEEGDVVLGHHDFQHAAELKALVRAKRAQRGLRVAYLAAAGHDKIRLAAAVEARGADK